MSQVEAVRNWGPGVAWRVGGWTLSHTRDGLLLTTASGDELFAGTDVRQLSIRTTWFKHELIVAGYLERRFDGLSRQDAAEIGAAIAAELVRADLAPVLERARYFRTALLDLIGAHLAEQRWIPHDRVATLLSLRPHPAELAAAARYPAAVFRPDDRDALQFAAQDPTAAVRQVNDRILAAELITRRTFFDSIETSPLTEEQARAVATFDNRVRVIAAAGSGKTSVMVARAGYAIARGFVSPERILLLAFNRAAAEELRGRVSTRLAAAGLPSEGVVATTFHAFGARVIGQATGRKPTLAPWVESGGEVEKIAEIIDQLRDASADFRLKWDVFRLLYARMSDSPDGGTHDAYDRKSRTAGFRTYQGETVRSEGERTIADWLYLNGVEYRYEQPYCHDVADSDHRQYRPDFYYPQIDVWHEHWALDATGRPPAAFEGYEQSMQWKRALHQRYGTRLIETTWHRIRGLDGLRDLAADLRRYGLSLHWDPDRPIVGAEPIEHARLARLILTFLSHVKANSLDPLEVAARLQRAPNRRSQLFLDLFWPIHARWQQELASSGTIDFDDMLLRAADIIEARPAPGDFGLILVDEFQDTSQSRARLVRALASGPEKYLLAVGDDWQAINRFAGADLTAMTDFEAQFGPAETVYLQTTFRTPQSIADVAGRFIGKNPAQLAKRVVATVQQTEALVTVVRIGAQDSLTRTIEQHLAGLARSSPGSTVDILGRYRHEENLVPRRHFKDLQVRFRTVHAAKGLEADHIFLPNLTTGTYGFPSQIEDDPVLRLVLARDDGYPHAEERRLFYVALTRARRTVTIFTVEGSESPFVLELLPDPVVRLVDATGAPTEARVCPACGKGTMQLKRGEYGEFLGCGAFPACTHKEKV